MHALNAAPIITATEKPVRLIRGVTLHMAQAGVELAKGDILESGASAMQIENPPKMIVALAPNSKVYIANLNPFQLAVLEGWIKFRTDGEPALLTSPFLQAHLKNNSLVLRAEIDKTEEEELKLQYSPTNNKEKKTMKHRMMTQPDFTIDFGVIF